MCVTSVTRLIVFLVSLTLACGILITATTQDELKTASALGLKLQPILKFLLEKVNYDTFLTSPTSEAFSRILKEELHLALVKYISDHGSEYLRENIALVEKVTSLDDELATLLDRSAQTSEKFNELSKAVLDSLKSIGFPRNYAKEIDDKIKAFEPIRKEMDMFTKEFESRRQVNNVEIDEEAEDNDNMDHMSRAEL